MNHFKRLFVLGSILLTTGLLFAFTPLASTAFAATTTAQRQSSVGASTMAHRAVTPFAAINGCPPAQAENNSGTWVQVIQFRLNNFIDTGFIPGPTLATDGVFGSATRQAVVNFQFAVGIGSSGGGVVGNRTWSAMGFCLGYSTIFNGDTGSTGFTHCPPSQSNGSSGILVQAIQALLNIDFNFGVFPTSPESFTPYLSFDGSFGSQTHAAVVDFQFAVGLGSSGGGVVGQRTWSELGMCF